MISAKINAMHFNKILKNTVKYSEGFMNGINLKRMEFNYQLANFTSIALGKYIDSQARMNPLRLHHVYEWGKAGNQSSRLFDFDPVVSANSISFTGKFLPSKSVSTTSDQPFVDKANIMENSIQVVIKPKNNDVLVFEDNGETVFTTSAIYIDHPGGDEVAGSFGETVNVFFNSYFTNALLRPLMNKLSTANEFVEYFPSGSRIGRNVGVRAGKEYLSVLGGIE